MLTAMCASLIIMNCVLAQDPLEALKKNPMDRDELVKLYKTICTTDNTDEKCRLGVIYCLGMFSINDLNEAVRIRDLIAKTYPTNSLLTHISDQSIFADCLDCEHGKIVLPCKLCKDKGKCNRCSGWIRIKDSEGNYINCNFCRATGKCPDCKGNGNYVDICKFCNGRARAFSQIKSKHAYYLLLDVTNTDYEIELMTRIASKLKSMPPSTTSRYASSKDIEALRNDSVKMPLIRIIGANAKAGMVQNARKSEFLRGYPNFLVYLQQATSPGSTSLNKESAISELFNYSHPISSESAGIFFIPFPSGLSYVVVDTGRKKTEAGILNGMCYAQLELTFDRATAAILKDEIFGSCSEIMCFESITLCSKYEPTFDSYKKGQVLKSKGWVAIGYLDTKRKRLAFWDSVLFSEAEINYLPIFNSQIKEKGVYFTQP